MIRVIQLIIRMWALSTMLLTGFLPANAQDSGETERLISASRGASSPLVFKADEERIKLVNPGEFHNDKETTVRAGLGNFFAKLASGKPVTIGFIGGSITQAYYGYRLQSAKYIQSLYPNVNFQFINAGVSGTGTDLGACRLKDQVLGYQPDLVFIEFAVNGAYQEGLEGMVRQAVKYSPNTDICLIYTIINGQTKAYVDGEIPENIKGLEKVAAHYGLPSIHLGMEAALMEREGKLIWKGDPKVAKNQLLFSIDGVHPTIEGGDLYAAAMARGVNKLKADQAQATGHTLPKEMFNDNWEDAKMLDPSTFAIFSKGWKKIITKENEQLKQFDSWFKQLMQTEKPGSYFTFKFKGSMFGFYDLGGPEVGQVAIEIDGKPVSLQEVNAKGIHYYKAVNTDQTSTTVINRFNVFCNNRYRGQYEFIEIEPGEHLVKVILSPLKADKAKILGANQQEDVMANPEKYDRTSLYLGKILIKGDIIK